MGPLLAAVEDVAHSVGAQDYDESVHAVSAIASQWESVADRLDVTDPEAVLVRMCAQQVREALTDEVIGSEMLPDLIALVMSEDELTNLALAWVDALEGGNEDAFWTERGEEVRSNFSLLMFMKKDLSERGELGLDDRLFPEDE